MPLAASLAIIAFAAAFHVFWALGGKLGLAVSLPQRPDGMPVMADRLPWLRPAPQVLDAGKTLPAHIIRCARELRPRQSCRQSISRWRNSRGECDTDQAPTH